MKEHKDIVDTPERLRALVATLENSPVHQDFGKKIIALDTEFIREKTFYPQIALIQVASTTDSWLIDPIAFDKETISGFLQLLSSPEYLKILHAAQADQECFFSSYGIVASPSFDTAVAGSLCGFGETPGLARLLSDVLSVEIEKGHARTDWMARPLPLKLVHYAHQDVKYLVRLASALLSRVKEKGRVDVVYELSAKYENTKLYNPTAEELATKISKNKKLDGRGFVTLVELVRWREARVKELNLPRKWVADDDLLVSLAVSRPADSSHLSAFRGLNKGELRISGEAILSAITRAMQIPQNDLPKMKRKEILGDEDEKTLDAVLYFLKLLSEKHSVSVKFFGTGETFTRLVREKLSSTDDFVSKGILSKAAADLIGEELLQFLDGKLLIGLKDGRRALVPTQHK